MQGFYFYSDFCSGKIWALRYDGAAWQKSPPFETGFLVTTFGEDEAGIGAPKIAPGSTSAIALTDAVGASSGFQT